MSTNAPLERYANKFMFPLSVLSSRHAFTHRYECVYSKRNWDVFWKQWRGKVGQMKQVGKCHLQFIEAQENQSQKGPRRSLVQHPAQSVISSGSCSWVMKTSTERGCTSSLGSLFWCKSFPVNSKTCMYLTRFQYRNKTEKFIVWMLLWRHSSVLLP